MTRANDDISVIAKTYDFTLWLLPQLAKFSRDHRFTLGNPTGRGTLTGTVTPRVRTTAPFPPCSR